MTPSWRTVGTGLRLVLIGAQVIGYSLAASVVVGYGGLFVFAASHGDDVAGWAVLTLVFIALGGVVIGRLLCAVGRWVCMATPPEAAKAPARIRLAVIFETCSLLGGAALVVVALVWPGPSVTLALIGYGFWLFTAALGRVCFFWFMWALAESVPLPTAHDYARFLARLSVATLAATVLGTALAAFGDQLDGGIQVQQPFKVFATVFSCILLFLALGFFLYLFVSHFLLIGELRKVLAAYSPAPSDADPDGAYRERYLAGGGSADDA